MEKLFKELRVDNFKRIVKGKNLVFELDKNGLQIPEKMTPTGHTCRITQREADINNSYINSRKLFYEEIVEDDKAQRKELFEKLEALGKKMPKNTKTEALEQTLKDLSE